MPVLTLWPKAEKAQIESFYGRFVLGLDGLPNDSWRWTYLQPIRVPYHLRLPWDTGALVTQVTCHRECAGSLQRIFGEIVAQIPDVQASGYDLFGGCYAYRAACGSHRLSFHAYGAAISLGPIRNAKYVPTPEDKIVDKIFEEEGWTWLGPAEGWGAITL